MGAGTPWVYIRTAGSLASVSLALNSAGTDSTYHNGDAIEITATFGENVTVTGTPQIPMTIGSNTRTADYSSGSGSTDLVFSYTVVTADVDNDGLEIAANALVHSGGSTIKTTVGDTAAAIDHGGVSANTANKVHGGAASVSTVEFINKPTGNYVTIGDSIEVKVTFDRPVTVTGAPRVTLSPAFGAGSAIRRAAYRSGSGSPALVFRYVLQDGDDSGTTNVSVAANALKLNSGTIRTGTENATITHTAANAGKTVSAKRPRITQVIVSSSPAPSADADLDGNADTYIENQRIEARISFDQNIAVDTMSAGANVQIVLTIGTTDYPLNYDHEGHLNEIVFHISRGSEQRPGRRWHHARAPIGDEPRDPAGGRRDDQGHRGQRRQRRGPHARRRPEGCSTSRRPT